MFGFNSGKCKRALQRSMSDCFDPLKDELGTVPTTLHDSKYITASMLGICEAYAQANKVTNKHKIALITDAVFEEVFRRESTSVLRQVDQWLTSNNTEFISAYEHAISRTNETELDLNWLKEYAVKHFEPSKNLML
ncbi:MAG: hypothetical protein R8G33_01175 [Gammaproteobacteria bacterium]|nr:hypothetical protein [Gammaproteobacteria bacterium]